MSSAAMPGRTPGYCPLQRGVRRPVICGEAQIDVWSGACTSSAALGRFQEPNGGKMTGPIDTVNQLVDAINRGDLERAVAAYEPEAVLVAQPGQLARGTSALRS